MEEDYKEQRVNCQCEMPESLREGMQTELSHKVSAE